MQKHSTELKTNLPVPVSTQLLSAFSILQARFSKQYFSECRTKSLCRMFNNGFNKSLPCSVGFVATWYSGSGQRVNVKIHLLVPRLLFLTHCFPTSFEWSEIFCLNKLSTEKKRTGANSKMSKIKPNCVGNIERRPGCKIPSF